VALLARGIGRGDQVITTPFTFIASANSILYTGARAVFVDIDPVTYNLNPDLIESAITPRTRAILPVHLFGLPCDMEKITAVAEKHNLIIIEDACQSHGAEYKDRKVGSFGTGTFSLYPTKNITSAEGGMITTNDDAIAEKCCAIRQHGMRRRYYHDELGFNYRMTDIHAAIGLEQLRKLEKFNAARRANARFLSENLKGVVVPIAPDGCRHVYHQYTVRVKNGKRDALATYLQEHEIGTGVYYSLPVHRQPFYVEQLGYRVSLPESERAADEVLSLPVHPGLSPDDLETIVARVNEFMAE
jgi:dTDP-4-amino-4,6-dideoxygalactose transaminase